MDISALRERIPGHITVSELNGIVKTTLENNRLLSSVTVKGEISNFTDHRSGHLYFSLKDSESQLKAVMFRSSRERLRFMPENGMKVLAHGTVSAFTRDGTYQLYVSSLEPDGLGSLYLAYEQLKAKLNAEGLFDEDHKKKIPRYPQAIGVITSPTGAAVRDIINVLGRRFPYAKVYLYPALVQGAGAEESLCRGIEYFNSVGLVDTVIIGRGGGSIEDLWAFNSERLARLIYGAGVPIISAVGHETDYTICDFVADLRAPTPSAAAELAVPDRRELLLLTSSLSDRLDSALSSKLNREKDRLNVLTSSSVLRLPEATFAQKRAVLDGLFKSLTASATAAISNERSRYAVLCGKLEVLSPLSVLSRGYALAQLDNHVITSAKQVIKGDSINIRLSDGSIDATVTEIREN